MIQDGINVYASILPSCEQKMVQLAKSRGVMMLSIQLNNPELESFIQDEYRGDENSLMRQFVEFLQFQKIKSEVKTSIEELDRDEFIGFDEAFEMVTAKYAKD